ncbi:MAG: single-stranded-DNA-specific exonuclease RecJ [Porphyromonas sp.]|nr:single-stranded-DNA-specific exonuclease RecJ [Porphyromonas sp.]
MFLFCIFVKMDLAWKYFPLDQEQKAAVAHLAAEARLLPSVVEVIMKRGIQDIESLNHYLSPSLKDLYDPFLMTGMDAAVNRLNKAIGNKEKILVYGDYDVDGITAVTLVYKYLRYITTNIDYYIPDRYEEGSGISKRAIDFAHDEGVTLMIALDCGIKANDMVAYAKGLNIDIIICDHHVPDADLPEAVANLNPKLPGSRYPFKELSGCGVGYKLMQAFGNSNGTEPRMLDNMLDLVAISIAADLVPLVGENRILAHFGLKKLNHRPSVGLRGIINVSGLQSKQIDMSDIIFKIGPRINASGRVQSGRESVDLLLTRDAKEAKVMSHHIDEYNNQRRLIDHSITQEANEIVESFTDMEDRKIIIVYDPSWHNGVIGIVASRLSERYNRPTIVLTDTHDDMINGSARSVMGYDIHTVLEANKDILENFGGHPFAAGFTIQKRHLHQFIQSATAIVDQDLTVEDLQPKHDIDLPLELADINSTLRRQLRRMAPYGPGNEKPLFSTRGVVSVTPPRLMGYKKSHLRLMISMPNEMPIYQAVAYNQADLLPLIAKGKPFDILYYIEESQWQGRYMVQLNIRDIHIVDGE